MSALSGAAALAAIWRHAEQTDNALNYVDLPEQPPLLPSSFAVGSAAQASIGAAALAAEELWHAHTGQRQTVRVTKAGAERANLRSHLGSLWRRRVADQLS